MSIRRISLEPDPAQIPYHVQVLLDETAEELTDWQGGSERYHFVPADYVLIFDALCTLRRLMPTGRPRYLEWGSGLGVATLLASALGWEADGVEIQPLLCQRSRELVRQFALPAAFHEGSFFPGEPNSIPKLDDLCGKADLIYVYPWPDQELEIFDLFSRMASPGSFLLAYYGVEDIRLFQKDG